MDDPANNPVLLTTTGKPEVTLKLSNDVSHSFKDMQALANFSDCLSSMVEGWRGSEEQKKLQGARKAIYEIVIEGMRQQIAAINPAAALTFPDNVMFGGGFIVDAIVDEEDATKFRCSVELHVRSIILLVANILASVKPVEPLTLTQQQKFPMTENDIERLQDTLTDALCTVTNLFDEHPESFSVEWKDGFLNRCSHWIKMCGAVLNHYDPRVPPQSKQPQVNVEKLVAKLDQ